MSVVAQDGVVRQRLVLVLPSTGEFDSRTYRIARTCHERGHSVTVLARWRPGLPREEIHPVGYRIIRVEAAAIDGLPLPTLVRGLRVALRRLYAWRTKTPYRAPGIAREGSRRGRADEALAGRPITDPTTPAVDEPERQASLPRRLATSLIRRLSIPLTVRAQSRAARRAAPVADIYHGMAYMGIPVALELARRHRARSLYDARDIYIDAANLARLRGPARWWVARAERTWAERTDRVLTVSRPYAEVMAGRWNIAFPLVVMNCSYRWTPPVPRPRRFHEKLGLAPETRVVLYQGGFMRDRGIEELMAAIHEIPDAVLVIMGYGPLEDEIKAAAARPPHAGKVHVLPAVAPTELLTWVASADVVGVPFQPTTLNHRLVTPNKFFEAMAVGAPVIASDLPGMAPIVRETGCGLVCDPTDPHALAVAARQILDAPEDERASWGAHALAAAHVTYNWEHQVAGLLDEYSRLTGRRW